MCRDRRKQRERHAEDHRVRVCEEEAEDHRLRPEVAEAGGNRAEARSVGLPGRPEPRQKQHGGERPAEGEDVRDVDPRQVDVADEHAGERRSDDGAEL